MGASSNITVTHGRDGVVRMTVLDRRAVTPHMVRLTFGGGGLGQFEFRGFDHWVRLCVPAGDGVRFDNLPKKFSTAGFARFMTLPKASRPVIRNYTLRDFRADGPRGPELDIDFVVHGDEGVAGPWAQRVTPGTEVAFYDQGCGWAPTTDEWTLLVADESGLPAVAGVLRDMARDARGVALIETFDAADRQDVEAPEGMDVRWFVRPPGENPGAAVLPELRRLALPAGEKYGFAVGESAVATGVRRHLVGEAGVPKKSVTFCGYWRLGQTPPSGE